MREQSFRNSQLEMNQDQSTSHGGRRPGAGRKRGSANKRTREIADRASNEGITPLEYMLKIMRTEPSPDLPDAQMVAVMALRFDAAKAAAPYMHARMAAIEHSGPDGGPIQHGVSLNVVGVPKG